MASCERVSPRYDNQNYECTCHQLESLVLMGMHIHDHATDPICDEKHRYAYMWIFRY